MDHILTELNYKPSHILEEFFHRYVNEVYLPKLGGYPSIPKDPLFPNVVFTIEGRTPEGYDSPIDSYNEELDENDEVSDLTDYYSFKIGSSEIETVSIPQYFTPNGEIEVNETLTNFMKKYFLKEFGRLSSGDIIKIEKNPYRNEGVFFKWGDEVVNSTEQEGFHDYGLPPIVIRKYYVSDWQSYGFSDNYPEYGTEEAERNIERKKLIV